MSSGSQKDLIGDDEGEISSTTSDHSRMIGMGSEIDKSLNDLPGASTIDLGHKTVSSPFDKDTFEDKSKHELSSSSSIPINEVAVETEIGSGDQTTTKNTPEKDTTGVKPEEIIDSPNDHSGDACPSLCLADAEKDSSSVGEELVLRWEEDDDDEIDDSLQLSPTDEVLKKLDKELGLNVECNTDKPMEIDTVTESLAGNPNKEEDKAKKSKEYESVKENTKMLSDPVETQSILQNTDSIELLADVEMAASTSFKENKKIANEIDELIDNTDSTTPENVEPHKVDIMDKVDLEVIKDISQTKQSNSIKHCTSSEIQSIPPPKVASDMDIDLHSETINQKTDLDILLAIDSGTTKITPPNEPETSNTIEIFVDESLKKDILEQIDEILDTTKENPLLTTCETSPEPHHKKARNVETDIDMEKKKSDESDKSGTNTTTKPDSTDISKVASSGSVKLETDQGSNYGDVKDKDVTMKEIIDNDKMKTVCNESITDKRHIDDIDLSQLGDSLSDHSLLDTTINPNIHHQITKPNIMLDIPTQDLSDIEAELDDSDSEFNETEIRNTQENVICTGDSKTEETLIGSVITQKEVTAAISPSSGLSLSTEKETSKLFKNDSDQSTSVETPTSKDNVVDNKTSLLKSVKVTVKEKSSTTDLDKKSGVEIPSKLGQIDVLKPSTPQAIEITESPTKLEINEKSTKSISDMDEIQSTSNSKQNNDENANVKNDTEPSTSKDKKMDVQSALNKNINEFTPNKKLDEKPSIIKEVDKLSSSLRKEVDESQSIMKDTDKITSTKNKFDETSSTVMESVEMPSTLMIENDVTSSTKKKNEDEVPSSLKKDLNEASSKNKELDNMLSTSKKDVDEVPTTSKVDDKLTSDKSDEVHEITDSLGLLAESFRVMDDDEGDDDEADDNEDDEDFDLYEEANSHMADDLDSNSPTPEVELKDSVEPSPRPQESDEGTMDVVDDIEYVENELPEIDIPDDVVSEAPSNDENVEKEEPEIIDADEHIAIPPPEKIITILEKVLGMGNQNANKETAPKSGKVLNYVEIEGSSDSDDVQEVSKSDDVQDGVISVNIPKGVDVMSTSARSTSEILSKGDEVVISGVPKPYTPKKTTINTSEVTIKTKPTAAPAIEIPEQTRTIEPKTPEDEESINLDSDEEEIVKQKEETPIVAEEDDKTKELIDKKCLNPDCTNESTVYYDASRATAAYYSLSRRGVVCELCRQRVSKRDEGLIQGIKDLRPLLGLEMDAPSQQLVEISDSDSEDDGVASDDVVGDVEAKFLEEQLADMMNLTWSKYNLDARLKETEVYLLKELEEIEAGAKEIDAILNDCQKNTDEIRLDFYKNYEPRRNSVGAITIHDTPFCSYSLNEAEEEKLTETQSSRYPKRKSSLTISDAPAKKPAIPLGGVPLDNKTVQLPSKEVAGDQKIDDDKEDIKVVKLSAEAAPADLPPCGEIVRAPLKVGMTTYAMRNAFGTWLKGKVQDILPKSSGQAFTQCRVKFEHKVKNPCKLLAARCLAYPEPSEVRMTIGTRLIAMFKDQENKSRQDSFSSGVVAEIPNPVNNFRYLVFFDHGYAQYVHHRDTRLVCESSPRVWEEVHPFISDFIYKYLLSYPERPMVRLHTGEKLKTEWNGKWWESQVMQVDASLALIHFDEDNRSEWIYRGSTRLAPLFLELEAAQKAGEGRGRSRLPRSKAQMRSNMPCVEYTREDAETARPTEAQGTHNEQDLRRQRSVAKKSTTQSAPAPPGITGTPFEGVISRVVYYTPKNAVKPYKMSAHICTVKCRRSDVLSLKDLRTYNPLAKPLLSGWERQTVRYRGHKEVMYRAPCGRRLRNIEELHKYLRTLQSDLSVDLFDFTPGTHCLAEFVLNKCIVGKKDLSHGKENVPVPCVNYYDDTLPEFCSYNTERTPTAGVPLNLDPDFLCGCDCTDDCRDKTKCACWKMTLEGARTIGLEGPNIGYSYRRLPEPLPSGIYECNSRCRCKQTCLNRVAQHPLQLKLQVFKTVNRGWGIRALNDIPKGAFICIYAGNLLTDATANLDGLNEGDEYLAELDYIEVVEGMKEGYEDDVPDEDKKLDKKSDSEAESSSESEEDKDRTEDGDFQPGYIPQPKGQVFFKKSLRKREKAKKKEEKEKQEQIKKRDDTITISDDEEVREPSRFTAEAGMGNISKNSSRVSVRTLFGKDEACYIMDAKVQGNIGRYLNHSCHPNVFVQNVFVDTHDPRFPWVAFFSLASVRAGTELTWNYNYDIGSVPDKVLYCYCGAPNCRGRLL